MDREAAAGILGVKEDATVDEAHKAFRRKAKTLHTDVATGDRDAFVALNTAMDHFSGKDAPKPSAGRAVDLMLQAYDKALENADVATDDLVQRAAAWLRAEIAQRNNNISAMGQEKKLVNEMLRRLVCSSEDDPIRYKFSKHLARLDEGVRHNEVDIANLNSALSLLARYSYERDQPNAVIFTATVSTSSGLGGW